MQYNMQFEPEFKQQQQQQHNMLIVITYFTDCNNASNESFRFEAVREPNKNITYILDTSIKSIHNTYAYIYKQ